MCCVAIKQQLKQPLSQGLIDSKINHYVPEIILRLVEIFDPEKIFLFGSYAWGIPNKDSDLDLLVIVSHHEKPPHQRATIAYTGLRDIPFPLDILVKTRSEFENF